MCLRGRSQDARPPVKKQEAFARVDEWLSCTAEAFSASAFRLFNCLSAGFQAG